MVSLGKRGNNNEKKFKNKRIVMEKVFFDQFSFTKFSSFLFSLSLSIYIYIVKIVKKRRNFWSNQLNLNTARFIWNDLPFDHHLLFRFEVGDGFIDTRVLPTCRRQCGASLSIYISHTPRPITFLLSAIQRPRWLYFFVQSNQADV